ncbi:MAG: hypothetical protein GF400_01950, partial [Candidatus Eisenbacteria bacterium]|nr:hypothetical protein [Candidatus Eisenbacteria bacterium]
AALGDIARARELTVRVAELQSLPRRINAGLLAAVLLGAAGAAVVMLRRGEGLGVLPSLWYGAALAAAAALSLLILRSPPWSWTMFVGGGLAVATSVSGWAGSRYVSAVTSPRRRAGAPIEELLIGIAEFKHGGAEGGSDEGRKSVTRLAYLAQEMLDSLDDEKRYSMLRERLALRAKSFLHSKHQLTRLLVEHAAAAGVALDEVRAMAGAADRIKEGLETVLGEEGTPAAGAEAYLVAIRNGRDELVRAADRAWDVVKKNPGCSMSGAVERILDSMSEEFELAGVRVEKELRVSESRDAVALWSSELDFVLENLLSNAVRYIGGSGKRRIHVSGKDGGAFYELRISDTGTGIPREKLDGLFDRREGDGTGGGFGLPNSREKLRRRGGDITVEDTAPAKGTTFLLTVPFWSPERGSGGINGQGD